MQHFIDIQLLKLLVFEWSSYLFPVWSYKFLIGEHLEKIPDTNQKYDWLWLYISYSSQTL